MTISLITGGSRGIGRAAALAVPNDVILTYHRDEAAAHDVVAAIQAKGRRAAALRLDVSDVASVPEFVGQVRATLERTWSRPTFDHLVNNAGAGHHALLGETTEADFQRQYDLHLKGPFFLTQALSPLLADGGRIVNVTTRLTTHTYPGQGTYAIMKAGLEAFTRYLARELGARGITANTVAPGGVVTDFGGGFLKDPTLQSAVSAETALGRVAAPEDVGDAIAALLGAQARWITGERIEITGGYRI